MELVPRLYPRLVENPDYTRIISPVHYERLSTLVGDARGKGARIVEINPAGEECNAENRVFPPTFALDVHDEMLVMREEIFGPILPIVPYKTLDDAIEYISERPRPLALYYFDRNKRRIDEVLRHTISGGVTVNDVLFHIAQHGLPFGGVGPSGLGHYHGVHGFRTFSKAKGVYFQSRWAGTRLLRPPYAKIPKVLIRTLLGRR
jgi:coniferyl-aldehyde dehydrogenase